MSSPLTLSRNPVFQSHHTYVFGILKSFGLGDLVDKFKVSGGIHDLCSTLTMAADLHRMFDNLQLWLEYTNEPSCYQARAFTEAIFATGRVLRMMRFEVDPDAYNVLNKSGRPCGPISTGSEPHAVCARVGRMSGAAEYFEKLDRDAESTTVLAQNGSSALLDNLLSRISLGPDIGESLPECSSHLRYPPPNVWFTSFISHRPREEWIRR